MPVGLKERFKSFFTKRNRDPQDFAEGDVKVRRPDGSTEEVPSYTWIKGHHLTPRQVAQVKEFDPQFDPRTDSVVAAVLTSDVADLEEGLKVGPKGGPYRQFQATRRPKGKELKKAQAAARKRELAEQEADMEAPSARSKAQQDSWERVQRKQAEERAKFHKSQLRGMLGKVRNNLSNEEKQVAKTKNHLARLKRPATIEANVESLSAGAEDRLTAVEDDLSFVWDTIDRLPATEQSHWMNQAQAQENRVSKLRQRHGAMWAAALQRAAVASK